MPKIPKNENKYIFPCYDNSFIINNYVEWRSRSSKHIIFTLIVSKNEFSLNLGVFSHIPDI